MEGRVRLEIDEMPLGLKRPGAFDYIGRYVGAAALQPLLQFDDHQKTICPGLLEGGFAKQDSLRHLFRVGQQIRWSDGRALSGEEIAERLRQARAHHPYWSHHLRWIDDVKSHGDVLGIVTRRPVRHLHALLCADELAPVWGNPWNPGAPSLGPYIFENLDTERSRLRFLPNPFFPQASERPALEFALRRDVGGVIDRFRRDIVHVTCSTMFPLSSTAEWSKHPGFHSGPAPIWMQIEFGAGLDPALLQRDVRIQLSTALDRNALSAALCGGATPRWSVLATTRPCGLCSEPTTASKRASRTLRSGASAIRLAFYDYYPNRSVAEFVQKSWAETLDLNVTLVSVPFGAPAATAADMRLELRYPLFPDPVAEIEPAMVMLARVGSLDENRRAARFAGAFQHGPTDGAEECLSALVDLLDETVAVIPLLDLRHHWLMHPNVTGFDLPHLASFDYRFLRFDNDLAGK